MKVAAGELTGTSAIRLAELIRTRAVSAVEVVDAHLERIEAVRSRVNAVVRLDADRAAACAAQADLVLARGDAPGPLHGVPFSVKDNIEAAGIEMAIGVPERAGVVPDRDATVVRRLQRAGAILLGKTNCPPWGGGIETDNPVYGRTNNPFDLDRTPGGSSGGAAADVASGGAPFGLGTDSGASVRLPAHFCGLASIKPTAGRVPVTGVVDDLGQIGPLRDPRTQVGVLARSVADVALVLAAIGGPDGRDGGVAPVALGDPAAVALGDLRVAVHRDDGIFTPTPGTLAALDAAAEAIRPAVARVELASPPAGGHELIHDVWRSYGDEMGAGELYEVLRRWDAYRGEMLAFAARHDVILCPVFPSPAVPHGATATGGGFDPTSYTTPYSLTGWPAATVRCGASAEGLPICVQVVAGPWRDDVALAAAQRIEEALGGWRPPPL